MRHFAAMIVITAFLAAQYAKQVSYLECRLVNSFKTKNEQCDCERFVSQKANTSNSLPFPLHHNHVHLDDLYDISLVSSTTKCQAFISHFLSDCLLPKEKRVAGIDRPPQVG